MTDTPIFDELTAAYARRSDVGVWPDWPGWFVGWVIEQAIIAHAIDQALATVWRICIGT